METSRRPLAVTLAVVAAVVVAAGLTRLVPYEYRPLNFTVLGALALFAAARLGLWPAAVLTFGAMLASDFGLLWRNDFHPDYLPKPEVYAGFAVYAVLGFALLRKTENPLKIGGVAVLGGLLFFLVTNFVSWLEQALPYGYSLEGLVNCYVRGLEFYRGTLLSDLGFSAVLFGAHAALSRVAFRAERVQLFAADERR